MDDFYIAATAPSADERTRVLKHGDTFGVFDRYGDVVPGGLGEEGVYHEGTRHLSRLGLTLGKYRPLLLSSTVQEDNSLLTINMTNPDFYRSGELALARGTLHIARARLIWKETCYERLRVWNFGADAVPLQINLRFDADFVDVFEVRGMERGRRGRRLAPKIDLDSVTLAYEGLDGVVRITCIDADPRPKELGEEGLRWQAVLEPRSEARFDLRIACRSSDCGPTHVSFDEAAEDASRSLRLSRQNDCELSTSNEQFNAWLSRSHADLHMMLSDTADGVYPHAGVPWYSTVFGRDGLITALEYLWVNPSVARGVLSYLGATQARQTLEEQDAEPGKILHETRKGEMAALREIPFGRYYGSVDSTPLFVLLAGAYYERTADLDFAASLWPKVDAALQWIDHYGDKDGDGFVEYERRASNGLVNQGWKDSQDSVFHADGRPAEGPIALCEVQAYVYAAKLKAAALAEALGDQPRALELRSQAARLKERFERAFWCEELATYALALDGKKDACRVRTSNAGHCLFGGIAADDRAWMCAQTLLGPQSFSGWGIRTVDALERRYNPLSYHNGSVWPHDNAMIASGLARYGYNAPTARLVNSLLEATRHMDLQRLPELFCGFTRRPGEGPTLYPVACSPQAWSSASVFMLLEACLGLKIDARNERLSFLHPFLPQSLKEIRIKDLRIGSAAIDLSIHRYDDDDVGINVSRRAGRLQVVVVK